MNSGTNGEADEDRRALERVLDQLYDFGDGPTSKKKLRSQKKKKRKRYEEEEEEEEIPAVEDICRDTGGVRADRVHAETEQTGPPVRQVNQVSQVEVVSFQDPRKKLKARQTAGPDRGPAPQITEKQRSVRQEELSLEKARLEVHRFGITGYKKEQQRVFEQDRAIMLGARPPKKSFVNYKQLQQQIKDKKQKAKEEVQPDLKDKKKKQSNQRDKKKKKAASSSSGTAPTGQVGRFKNGMLILSSKEIQKIKGNKPGR
ncbi:40S small subunit processome assembly factor 1 isoform X2 [Chaetodon auriga]|uniref:40S small subunit processome assembly factor 1 isoform X2 n=1 Tax=Chaetodon auriga TaxID=39042 RepID=UPI004032FEBA